jgi:hypothetical protein
MSKFKILSLQLISIIFVFWYSVPYSYSNELSRPENIKTLTLHIPEDLDASKTISYNSILLIDNLFPRLFRINENLQFEGEVANSWKVDQNKKIIYVEIDNTSKFSDGSYITTKDIASSISRIIDPKSLPGFFFKNIKKITALNEKLIAINYVGWDVAVLNQLGSPFLPIYKNGKSPFKNDPSSWITSSRYSIRKWSNDELAMNVFGKDIKSLSVETFEKVKDNLSSIDLMISRLNWISSDTLKKQINNQFNTYVFDSFNISVIMANIKLESEYRKCLAFKSLNNKDFLSSMGELRIKSILPPSMFSYDSNLKLLPVPKPKNSRNIKFMVQKADSLVFNIFEQFKTLAKDCNLNVEIDEVNNTTYINKLIKHEFDLAYVTISVLYNDPFFVFSFFHRDSRFNFSGSNQKISKMVDDFPNSQNQYEALIKSKALQKEIISEGLAIPLITVKSMSFVRKPLTLKGHSLFDVTRWEDVL